MVTRRHLLALAAGPAFAQKQELPRIDFLCPMDRDVRTKGPGKCPRCGMRLVANLPEAQEFRLDLKTMPRAPRSGQPVELHLAIRHPKTGAIVKDFEVVHERIFHLFLIGQNLGFFAHEHPEQRPDGRFLYKLTLPDPGAYRLVADCYPKGETIQFLMRTLITADADPASLGVRAQLPPRLTPQQGANVEVKLTTEPSQPLAGKETILFFDLSPGEGLEQYLGAWGHMLVGSDDLIDLVHDHPLYADGGPRVQFNVIFPREAVYRVWVQFQRRGVVNTVAFNVPVKALR